MSPNLVQVEFFHVGMDSSFAKLMCECAGRAADGVPIKTHLRFYDERGQLTEFAIRAEWLLLKKRRMLTRASRWGWPLILFFGWRMRIWAGRLERLKQRALEAAVQQLHLTARAGHPIALEDDPAGPLRLVCKDELHETLESARQAKRAWIWVFEPNGLLSEKNKLIGSLGFNII